MTPRDESCPRYDVVVIGGAFSGASAALLLRRWCPEVRILVLERRESFDWKVGEATVEISGLFLTRVLGLYDHLVREHLPKHGLRFWFGDEAGQSLEEISEVGPHRVSGLPSFQLDRSKLDEEILRRARTAGAEVLRPAKVTEVELAWPESRVVLRDGAEEREITARWVLDASGRQVFLGRRLGIIEEVERHPLAAAWGRWRGVTDLDGDGIQGPDPAEPRLPPVAASRSLATNHFCGYGYWCWMIPLAGGETSLGVVYDKRHFELAPGGSLPERYERFLRERVPGLGELLAGARPVEGDFYAYKHLPYRATRYADRGWALLGDAAAFLDPYYSPGLDHAALSIYSSARIVEADLRGELEDGELDERLETHNGRWSRSYDRWLDALYLDKYEILGDAELTTAAFLFDTGMYYRGVVYPVWRDLASLENPVLGLDHPLAELGFRLMRAFRRRLVRLARFRRRAGIYGRRNSGWKSYPTRFDIDPRRAFGLVASGLAHWLRAEAGYLLYRLRHRKPDLSTPAPSGSGSTAGG